MATVSRRTPLGAPLPPDRAAEREPMQRLCSWWREVGRRAARVPADSLMRLEVTRCVWLICEMGVITAPAATKPAAEAQHAQAPGGTATAGGSFFQPQGLRPAVHPAPGSSSAASPLLTLFPCPFPGHCLLDQPAAPLHLPVTFPGKDYDADRQCQLTFGPESHHCPQLPPPCAALWCSGHLNGHAMCQTKHSPWADGTPCGPSQACMGGRCLHVDRLQDFNVRSGAGAGRRVWGGAGPEPRRKHLHPASPSRADSAGWWLGTLGVLGRLLPELRGRRPVLLPGLHAARPPERWQVLRGPPHPFPVLQHSGLPRRLW